MPTTYAPGEFVTWYAVDGHKYGNEADLNGRLWSTFGRHQDDCNCYTAEEPYYFDGMY